MSNKKLVSTLNTIERSMRKVLMESENGMRSIESSKVEAYILSNLKKFTDEVKTKDGAKAFLVKNDYRKYVNFSNYVRDEVRKAPGGSNAIDTVDKKQLEELKHGIVPLDYDVKDKEKTAAKVVSTIVTNRSKNKKSAVATAKEVQAPVSAPKTTKVESTPADQSRSVKIMSKTVTTGNSAVDSCNKFGINSQAFKATCRAFGLSLIALGIYLGYRMYPNAKEQFIQAWDNGNPNKERLIALLKGVGACLLVVGLIGCGIYLVMHGFKQEEMENDNSFTFQILNASANIVNGIADYF